MKGIFLVLMDSFLLTLSGTAQFELIYMVSSMKLFPGEQTLPRFDQLKTFGFQDLLRFALYLPFLIETYNFILV
jgi:hypothetical protein